MAVGLYKWLSGPILSLFAVLPAASGRDVGTTPHPLYVTVTEINHNAKDKILEISCKVFTNDFESVLEKVAGARVDLSAAFARAPGGDAGGKASAGKLIAGYVERHLRLKIDGRPVQLQYVGSENEQDGTWSYFQVNNVPTVKRIDAVDELLYDGFNTEINILHVTVGGQRQSTRLDCPASAASFQF